MLRTELRWQGWDGETPGRVRVGDAKFSGKVMLGNIYLSINYNDCQTNIIVLSQGPLKLTFVRDTLRG